MTYKENVRKVAEALAIIRYERIHKRLKWVEQGPHYRDIQINDKNEEARAMIAFVAEELTGFMAVSGACTLEYRNRYLIERGLIPAPVSCAHGAPCTERSYVCGINSPLNERL